jgi:hypothetical protein
MAPELLRLGRMSSAADVYAFSIMSEWRVLPDSLAVSVSACAASASLAADSPKGHMHLLLRGLDLSLHSNCCNVILTLLEGAQPASILKHTASIPGINCWRPQHAALALLGWLAM